MWLKGLKEEVMNLKSQALQLIQKSTVDAKQTYTAKQLMAMKERLGTRPFLQNMASAEVTVPIYWANHADKQVMEVIRSSRSASNVVTVSPKTQQAVCQLVASTWKSHLVGHGSDAQGLGGYTSLKVHKVERVENLYLWKTYAAKRADMCLEASKNTMKPVGELSNSQPVSTAGSMLDDALIPEINECYLFHGTETSALSGITAQGIDHRLSSARVLFGRGTYFAESSSKADQYAGDVPIHSGLFICLRACLDVDVYFTDPKNSRTQVGKPLVMLLCRVLLGNVHICLNPQDFSRPPCMTCNDDKCKQHYRFHDSVIGVNRTPAQRLNFREFVIYDRVQCYPEYIIHYTRQ